MGADPEPRLTMWCDLRHPDALSPCVRHWESTSLWVRPQERPQSPTWKQISSPPPNSRFSKACPLIPTCQRPCDVATHTAHLVDQLGSTPNPHQTTILQLSVVPYQPARDLIKVPQHPDRAKECGREAWRAVYHCDVTNLDQTADHCGRKTIGPWPQFEPKGPDSPSSSGRTDHSSDRKSVV